MDKGIKEQTAAPDGKRSTPPGYPGQRFEGRIVSEIRQF